MREGISSKPVLVKRLEISPRRQTEIQGEMAVRGHIEGRSEGRGEEEDGIKVGKVWDTIGEMY